MQRFIKQQQSGVKHEQLWSESSCCPDHFLVEFFFFDWQIYQHISVSIVNRVLHLIRRAVVSSSCRSACLCSGFSPRSVSGFELLSVLMLFTSVQIQPAASRVCCKISNTSQSLESQQEEVPLTELVKVIVFSHGLV